MMNKLMYTLLISGIFLTACQQEKAQVLEPGLDLSLIDTTISPSDDFFRYVNGKWLDNTDIPSDRSRWGSFDELRKKSSEDVLKVLEASIASGKYEKGTDQYKASAFYETAMDVELADKTGLEPLTPYLEQIAAIEDFSGVQKYIENTAALGSRCFLDFAIFPDLKNSSVNAAYLTSGSLGLPERDYYLKSEEDYVEKRKKYVTHIVKMMKHLGVEGNVAQEKAENILNLETKLASEMMSKEESRNPTLMYNKKSMSDLEEMMPGIVWTDFFTNLGAKGLDTIIVMDPKYTSSLPQTLSQTTVQDWKDYLTWNELNNSASFLSSEIENDDFDFYGKTLRGTEQMRPRWEKVLDVANGSLGEAIGKLYVDEHFPPEAKEKAQKMVDYILAAYEDRINGLEWMTPETKKKALEKLNNFTVKIGYPDEWEDYSNMDIKGADDGGTYASNMIAVSKWAYEKSLSKLGKEVDKKEWGMSPQTVNAYYNPLNNEIVFPAAILQPPFYNYKADEAINYGGIGAVIGHEISHGFDDQGSRFDATGNMTNWWTDEDREAFDARNKVLIEQFNAYEPLPGIHVNGEFTLGENIGDIGGVNSAYDGLQKYLADNDRPDPIDGLTPEQRFFMSWGTIWRTKMRDEEMKTRINTDPHSPGQYRANGPLSNMPEFYAAFNVKEGDSMYRQDSVRVKIW